MLKPCPVCKKEWDTLNLPDNYISIHRRSSTGVYRKVLVHIECFEEASTEEYMPEYLGTPWET